MKKLAAQDKDKLLWALKRDGSGVKVLIDGEGLPPIWAANATKGIAGVKKAFRFTE